MRPRTVRIEKLCSMLQRSKFFLKIVTYFIRALLSNPLTQFPCSKFQVTEHEKYEKINKKKEEKTSNFPTTSALESEVFKN